MTLRSLLYRLISAGELENSKPEYKRLGRILTRLREAGDVPITGWVVDRVRETLKPSSWTGLADYGETVRHAYRKDLWAQMPHHIELFVEKDAIAGTIQPTTEEYDVALNVIRGDVSLSFAGEIAERWAAIQKPIFAYYLGDFDPAGFDIERVLREKLQRYTKIPLYDDSGRYNSDPENYWKPLPGQTAGIICLTRIGVLDADFLDEESGGFSLLALPVKKSARSKKFIKEHGEESPRSMPFRRANFAAEFRR